MKIAFKSALFAAAAAVLAPAFAATSTPAKK